MQRTSVTSSTPPPPPPLPETLIQPDDNASSSSVGNVDRKMLFFTILMTTAPFAAFYIAKDYVFEGLLDVSQRYSYTYSAIVAVIVVHIVLITFLFVAFREEIPGDKKSNDEATRKKD